ncbi:MAG: o-succinylbenzoate synthase, partial [Cyanobacteriota bacterium]
MSASAEAGAGVGPGEPVSLHWRPFCFPLPAPLRTASGRLERRQGWLLRLETTQGAVGWGEAAPLAWGLALEGALASCAVALEALAGRWNRADL